MALSTCDDFTTAVLNLVLAAACALWPKTAGEDSWLSSTVFTVILGSLYSSRDTLRRDEVVTNVDVKIATQIAKSTSEAARATNTQQTWRQEFLGSRSSTVERYSTRTAAAGTFLRFL